MADEQDAPNPSQPQPLDDLIAAIRAAVAPDASDEIRAIAATACRSILTALEAPARQLEPDGGAPAAKFASSIPEQPASDSDTELANDVSAGALLREVAHIEDTALPAHYLVQPGDILGPYRIVRELGRGANGVVFEAEDQQLLRPVALKVLALAHVTGDEPHRRLLHEARAASAVVHPNIAAVYAVGHDRGLEYLAMEYVSGITLRELVRSRSAPFEIAEVAQIGAAIASGVGRAHELGIVHRDLKPENVMITDTGAVKVLDFGLARSFTSPAGARDERLAPSPTITVAGRVAGTPAYMAPEQSRGGPVDARCDVFALGVMLYELVTRTRPFRGETAAELVIAIGRDEPWPPSAMNPQVPPVLEAIVLRCLCKSPGERFASCGEVAKALRRVPAASELALLGARVGTELRLASIVRVTLPPISLAAADSQDLPRVLDVFAGHGAHATVLVGGVLVAAFLQRPAGACEATDLAAQAMRCAVAARDTVPGAAIAIATGRTLLVGTTPTGEVANRAAALSGEADGTEIVVDELSAGLLDGRYRVRRLGPGVFALDRAAIAGDATRLRLGAATTFVGRDAELATLDAALRACRDEAAPRVVLVVGPAGQGKTRLLHEWRRRTEARADPPLILVGRADPVCGAAGGVLAQALRPALDLADAAAPEEMARHVERAWLVWLRATCAAQPTVIALEDLQWSDEHTIALVTAALLDLTGGALLVLAFARPEVDDRFPGLWADRALRVALGPLARQPREVLAREALGTGAELAVIEGIVQLSEGNARVLEQLVRAAAEGRGREPPGTVIAMLQARIERLAPVDRRVLRAASVLGEWFRDGDVAALLGADRRELDGRLRSLVERELVAAHCDGTRVEHRFRHVLMREAAYGMLPELERRALHRAAAEHLARRSAEPAVVAEHLARAGLPAR